MAAVALPPGPGPAAMNLLGWTLRPIPFMERNRRRYGQRFTVNLGPPEGTWVFVADPDELKQVFTTPADVLHPGVGGQILEPVVGPRSVLLLDEGAHLRQRKLMLPAFHGERMRRLVGVMEEVAAREVASWPRGEASHCTSARRRSRSRSSCGPCSASRPGVASSGCAHCSRRSWTSARARCRCSRRCAGASAG